MERPWIKTCVKVQFTPSFLTQAEQPQWTTLKREFVFLWSKLMQTFFHPVKKCFYPLSLFQQSSVLAKSALLEVPVANVRLLISGTVETVWFQQSTNSFSNVPNIETVEWCLLYYLLYYSLLGRITPECCLFPHYFKLSQGSFYISII